VEFVKVAIWDGALLCQRQKILEKFPQLLPLILCFALNLPMTEFSTLATLVAFRGVLLVVATFSDLAIPPRGGCHPFLINSI
jgi:hypothetical protein